MRGVLNEEVAESPLEFFSASGRRREAAYVDTVAFRPLLLRSAFSFVAPLTHLFCYFGLHLFQLLTDSSEP